jgi:membrane-associated protease RseP (regulator of RpoE activity)
MTVTLTSLKSLRVRCVAIAMVLLLAASSHLSAQDFLKQLTDKLSQKQNETKEKGSPASEELPPAKEPSGVAKPATPFVLPSVLDTDDSKVPSLLKPQSEPESLELPPPNVDPNAQPKSPPIKRSSKPASPFPKTTPSTKVTPPAIPPTKPIDESSVAQPSGGGFLGLTVESIPGGGFGLTVVDVVADSPAWKAGFRNGDKVIGISGQAVSTPDAFGEHLGRFNPGTPVKFLVERRGKTANLIAILQDRGIAGQIHGLRPGTSTELNPEMNSVASNRPAQAYFGVNVKDMSEAYRRQFSIPAYRGASVTEVIPNSPAHFAGIKPGDCIVEIEGSTVQSAELVFDTIVRSKPGQLISVSYYRGRQLNSAVVKLAADSENPDARNAAITPEMLTPEYVATLQGELERVHSELSQTQARLQQLETRLQRIEGNR